MNKLITLSIVLSTIFIFSGCNAIQRSFGGNITLHVNKGQKVVYAGWTHDHSIDVLTKPMSSSDQPEVYTLQEHSNFGLLNTTVTIIESK